MEVTITDAERDLLLRILETARGDTRSEVRRTRNPEWHDGLKKDEAILAGLMDKLRED